MNSSAIRCVTKAGRIDLAAMINVALPKGRLGEKVYKMFEEAGYGCPDIFVGRKLVFENRDAGVRYFWVKPSDVPIYVERGAADIGVAGKDILLESAPNVYELADLGIGKCRMVVAAPRGFEDDSEYPLRVATKFVNIAQDYYASVGRDIDIIKLNGSIEIADPRALGCHRRSGRDRNDAQRERSRDRRGDHGCQREADSQQIRI